LHASQKSTVDLFIQPTNQTNQPTNQSVQNQTNMSYAHKPGKVVQYGDIDFNNPLGPGGTQWPVWVTDMGVAGAVVFVIVLLAVLAVWIAGLVRMGHCGGRQSWLWWCTIFIPLFVPVVGQLWAVVVGIVALVMLGKPGGKLLTMEYTKPGLSKSVGSSKSKSRK